LIQQLLQDLVRVEELAGWKCPHCLRVPVPFIAKLVFFREPGKSQIWGNHSYNHHIVVLRAQS